MTVLVLGANGLIGRQVVAALGQKVGKENVIAGVRNAAKAPPGYAHRIVDACSEEQLQAALDGVTHVVTCVMGSNQAIVGSARTLSACAKIHQLHGVVHLSSVAVFGRSEGFITEVSAQGNGADGYGLAKIEAERLLAETACKSLTFVRPALVYGPGSWLWTTRIASLLKAGRLGDLGTHGEGDCNLVYVDDVASIVVTALLRDEAARESINVAAPDPPSWNKYLADFAQLLDVPLRKIGSVRLQAEALAAYPLKVAEVLGARLGYKSPTPLTPRLRQHFAERVRYDSAASKRYMTEWTPYDTGLRLSAQWVREMWRR